ncbi:MAG TPA: class I SAM-dependent methyltransferase [Sphingobium sp.]|nr:class I SAM-dependent methyltransferase [Sphingobium sp.]
MASDIPMPPVNLRRSVGVEDPRFFENPRGSLVFGDLIAAEKYERIFDFGCGCGRTARQLLLQETSVPKTYYGVDLFRPSIDWCRDNLTKVNRDFTFHHLDTFNAQFNPRGKAQVAFSTNEKFSLLNAHSVFTHIVERNMDFYFSECVRLLEPGAIMRSTWFLFDKQFFPMMQEFQNCLYINEEDCTNATIYDLRFVQSLFEKYGQRIVDVRRPGIRGHQWVIISANEAGESVAFPYDDADFGLARPPVRM